MDFALIGKQIRNMRKQNGLTQEALAERAKMSAKHLSRIEHARKKVSIDLLEQIASALDVPLTRLLAGNIPTGSGSYMPEIQELVENCSVPERQVIYDVAMATKQSLQRNLSTR